MSDFSVDILDQVSSTSEIIQNLDDLLPKLITILQNDSCNSYFSQILITLLKNVLVELEVDQIEQKLLRHLLPCIKQVFSQSLSSVNNIIETAEENEVEDISVQLCQFLQVCLDVLNGYNDLLDFVTLQKNEIKLDNISSLHKTLPEILLQAFTHCKESEATYGPYFILSTDILTSLFRKSYEIHLKYFKALDDKLSFSCSFEDDIVVLTEVLETINTIIEIVTGLDIKTAAEQWKNYIKISSKYAVHIRDRLNISRPLALSAANIHQIVRTVTIDRDSLDDKSRIRQLKLGSFILKVFIKLCELNQGYLDDCLTPIFDLLILLQSCSKTIKTEKSISSELDLYICKGGTALLNILFVDENFANELHKLYINSEECPDNKVGLLFIILIIMKQLTLKKNKALYEKWDNYPLVEMIFHLYNDTCLQLDLNSEMEGKDLYTNIVSIVMAYILSSVTTTNFTSLENLLFKNLYSINIHTALLASDLLCLLARFTTESVCLNMVQYLSETLNNWPDKHRPEYIVSCATLTRLARLLTDKSYAIILAKYCQNYSNNVSYLLIKINLKKNNSTVILPPISTLKEDYNTFMNKLRLIALKGPNEDESESDKYFRMFLTVLKVVQMQNQKSELGNNLIDILACQYISLLPSFLPHLTNLQILQILNRLEDAIKCCNTTLKFSTSNFLFKIANNKFTQDGYTKEILMKIANIFAILLMDKDSLIKQKTLETYSHFILVTSHENIATLVHVNNIELQKILTQFLQKKAIVQSKLNQLLLTDKQRYFHKCFKKTNLFDGLINDCPPNKKLKSNTNDDTNIIKSLTILLNEAKYVEESLKSKYNLSEQIKVLFKEVSVKIDQIKDSIVENELINEFS